MDFSTKSRATRISSRSPLIFVLIQLFYCVAQIPLHFFSAYTPDDVTFYGIARQIALTVPDKGGWAHFIFSQTNVCGYGALYWILYASLLKIPFLNSFPNAMFTSMSIVAYLCVCLIPLCIFLIGFRRKSPYAIPAVILWLLFPAAWWTGKLTAPETLAMAVGMGGLVLTLQQPADRRMTDRSFLLGCFLLGITTGLKLTAGVFVPFSFGVNFIYYRRTRRSFLAMVLMAIGGFFFANPFALGQMPVFLKHVAENTHVLGPSWSRFWMMLRLPYRYQWDCVFDGGLTVWSLTGTGWLVLGGLFAVLQIPWGILFVYFFTGVIFLTFLSVNAVFFGWYLFPLIVLTPIIMTFGRRQVAPHFFIVGFILLLLSSVPHVESVVFNYRQKIEYRREILMKDETGQEILNWLHTRQRSFDHIFNFTEVGLDFPFLSGYSKKARTFRQSYLDWFTVSPDLPLEGQILIIVGDRVRLFSPYAQLNALENGFITRHEQKFRVIEKIRKGQMTFYISAEEK
jgi:hypothetical protein